MEDQENTASGSAVAPTTSAPPVTTTTMMGQPPPRCIAGLEYLAYIDQLIIHQQLEMLEMFIGFEMANKYVIKNVMGQFVFFAAEQSDCCTRCILGQCRPFDMRVLDYKSREVMRFFRPLRCDSCCCFCCLQRMEVQAPPSNVIGYVVQELSLIYPHFKVQDVDGQDVLRIKGPFLTSACFGDVKFDIMTADGQHKVGHIIKTWSGALREFLTDVDHYSLAFPIDMAINVKALLLGATFLIEYMFFESRSGGAQFDLPGMAF